MPDRVLPQNADTQMLWAEIARLHKIINALMEHAEQNQKQDSDFNLFQSEIMLREQVRLRTYELEAALTKNEKITRDLKESEERFQQLFEQSMVGIVMTDGQHFIQANPKFAEIIGYEMEEICCIGPPDVTPVNERAHYNEFMKKRLAGEITNITYTRNILRKDGQVIVVEISGGSPINVEGKPMLISALVDVTEKIKTENAIRELNRQLREQSIRDPLTGLYNRRFLEESVQQELKRAQRSGLEISFIIGDLDYFKKINDTFGHKAGDLALCIFAELLKRHARDNDIFSRYGGEEFMLVLPGMPADKARARAEKIRQEFENTPLEFNRKNINITASFGVACYPSHGTQLEELFMAADNKLYQAKKEGRNRVC